MKALQLLLILCLFFSSAHKAEAFRVRAVLPNPSADESTEWIAVENDSSATVSANLFTIKDTLGATKSYKIPFGLAAGEVREISHTISNITLNNDQDAVQLLQNGSVLLTTPVYSSPADDMVWIELSSGWKFIPLAEWKTRSASHNWLAASPLPTPMPSSFPSPNPSGTNLAAAELVLSAVSPCTSPEWIEVSATHAGAANQIEADDSTGVIVKKEDLEFIQGETKRIQWSGSRLSNEGEWLDVFLNGKEAFLTYAPCQDQSPYHQIDGVWQQANGEAAAVATPLLREIVSMDVPEDGALSEPQTSLTDDFYEKTLRMPQISSDSAEIVSPFSKFTSWPVVPTPDFDAENKKYMEWRRLSVASACLFLFAGACAFTLTFPRFFRWYNEQQNSW